MSELLDLVAKTLSFEKKQAILVASHLKAALQPDALLLCPVVMAGEETALHAIALGCRGQTPEVLSVPDPRDREESTPFLMQVGERIESYFASCRSRGTFPQLVVSSVAEVRCLDALSERCRAQYLPEAVQRLGALLAYPTERYESAGQQTLLTATGLLSAHYAFGQQESEHLGALLHWLVPPTGGDFFQALREIEEVPMGIRTPLALDRELEPLLHEYKDLKRSYASPIALSLLRRKVHLLLFPVVELRYRAIEKALSLLEAQHLPYLPPLQSLSQREAEEFASFMLSRDKGFHLPKKDSAKAATFKLSTREEDQESYEAALLYHDPLAQARARLAGIIIDGIVEEPIQDSTSKPTSYRFVLLSQQTTLHLRKRDELCLLSDPRLSVVVTNVQKAAGVTRIHLQITKGMRAVGLPAPGQELSFGPTPPNFGRIFDLRKQLKNRLSNPSWTHQEEASRPRTPPEACSGSDRTLKRACEEASIPASGPNTGTLPEDPLAALEALQ